MGTARSFPASTKRRLNRLCDKYNLSQVEVFKILLDLHDRAERLGMIHFQPAVLTMTPLPGEPEPPQPQVRVRKRQGGHRSKPYSNKGNADARAKVDQPTDDVEAR